VKDIKQIISQMTLEEKVSLCSGKNMWELNGIERLGIPSIMMTNGPHGLQKQVGDSDHIGMANSVPATCFPPAVAQAATWNRDLIYKLGEALGEECRQERVGILLGPGINIKRSPLGGRNYDYYSEDPYLAGEIAKQHIKGVQSQGVGTSLKHFAVSNQEFRRMTINVVVDERALREIYLAGFENIVKDAQPWTVMNAYHVLNGEYCSENNTLITEILKKEWGFDGFVVSDWGSVNDRVAGIKVGVDLEMPGPSEDNRDAILKAVRSGDLDEPVLDYALERILTIVFKAADTLQSDFTYDAQVHHDLARKIAEEGIVLLKNEQNILPIDKNSNVALLGRIAKEPRFQGGGSSLTNPTQVENLYDEMVSRLGLEHVTYAPGYPVQDTSPSDDELIAEALEVAQEADVVVVLAGTREAEGGDHQDLKLPASHTALIEKVAAENKQVIVLLSNGAPVEMPWVDNVLGIVEGYLAGQAAAGAQADILLGNVNPSGKLGESFPIKLEDNPSHPFFPGGPGTVEYRESIYVGYRYYDSATKDVLFPFGFGLSYTTFEYSDLHLTVDRNNVTASFNIKNTGTRFGKETAQVYVRDLESTVFRPYKELKGFTKVGLQPGEETTVSVELDRRAFAFYDVDQKDWVVETGEFEILVGTSSQDIRLTGAIEIESEQIATPVTKKEKLSAYYDLTGTEFISQDDFETLYGRSLPVNEIPQKGNFTFNTPIGDMSETFIGRQLYNMMLANVKKMFSSDESEGENPMLGMVAAMLKEMPLRSMLMMSNGALKRGTLDSLLMMINGKGLRGFFSLVKSLVIKK